LFLVIVVFSCEKPETPLPDSDFEITTFKSSLSKNSSLTASYITDVPFEKREGHTSILYDDKLWLIGGYTGNIIGIPKNDIWQSKDGHTWKEVPTSKHFSARTSHTTTVFKDRIWVIGGNQIPGRTNDVWASGDGVHWLEITANAAFSKRSSHTTVVFDGKLWVIGGLDENSAVLNDVWYTKNGADWFEATSNASFSPRFSHTTLVYKDMLWVIGGRDFSNWTNDVWYSKDGVLWKEATPKADFSPRSGHTSVIYDNLMWVLGGSEKSGLVRMEPIGTICP